MIWDLEYIIFFWLRMQNPVFYNICCCQPYCCLIDHQCICKTVWYSFSKAQWTTLCGLTPTGVLESTAETALGVEAPDRWMYVCR